VFPLVRARRRSTRPRAADPQNPWAISFPDANFHREAKTPGKHSGGPAPV